MKPASLLTVPALAAAALAVGADVAAACSPRASILKSPRVRSQEVQAKALNDRGDVVGFADGRDGARRRRLRPDAPGLRQAPAHLPRPLDLLVRLIFGSIPEFGILRGVPATSECERMLRGAALRVTRPRVAVLTAVHDHPHADTRSIIGIVREDSGQVSHQAVYDALRALTAAGLVRRIQPSGSSARYESGAGNDHQHIVCRSCGAISDVDGAVGATPCLTAPADHGFAIDEAEVIYWGLCPACTASDPRKDSRV